MADGGLEINAQIRCLADLSGKGTDSAMSIPMRLSTQNLFFHQRLSNVMNVRWPLASRIGFPEVAALHASS